MSTYSVPLLGTEDFIEALPADATELRFNQSTAARPYFLTRGIKVARGRKIVFIGCGSTIVVRGGMVGISTPVMSMDEAAIETTITIRDFAEIKGGAKAIDLQGTLRSVVENCKLSSQTECAIDLRFALMTSIRDIDIVNPAGDGVRVRPGDWSGAAVTNCQSNQVSMDKVRVYCQTKTIAAFRVLNAQGCTMRDCVAEGYPPDYSLYLSARTNGNESLMANNPVVKGFSCTNFHIEHAPRIASLYINMPSKASVNIDAPYWAVPQKSPVILYTMGQLNLSNVGWWNGYKIATRVQSPRISIRDCTDGITAASVKLADEPLAGNTVLTPAYVSVAGSSK